MSGILWLASYPKSGNTWLRSYLQNLLTDAKTPGGIENITQFTKGDAQRHLFQHVSDKPVDDMTAEEIAALRLAAHGALAQSSPDTVMVKTHCYLGEYCGYPQISMKYTSGTIYIIRNPLDVCISMAPHFGIGIDEAIDWMADSSFDGGGGEEEVPYHISSWSTHVSSWTATGASAALHIVRYEDMLYKSLPTFKGVAKFLGLKLPAERIKRAIKFSSFSQLRKQEDKSGFVETSVHADRFFRVGKAGQWKSVLSKDQIDKVVESHHEIMEKFKYLP